MWVTAENKSRLREEGGGEGDGKVEWGVLIYYWPLSFDH